MLVVRWFIRLVLLVSIWSLSGQILAIPKNAQKAINGWECSSGFRKQGQQCNPIYIPPNARLAGKKWVCLPGYERKSNQCNPVKSPRKSVVLSELKKDSSLLEQAKTLYQNENYEEAFESFLTLAERGGASAQFYLAELYYSADSMEDKRVAISWYEKAAIQGNAYAQYNLANAYFDGKVVPVDFKKAAELYERAAKSGLHQAQLNLGYMYGKGQGVQQNDRLATLWYKAAANFGNAKAQSNLGFQYCKGLGVKKSFKKCAFWVQKAIAQGSLNAKKIWNAFELQKLS